MLNTPSLTLLSDAKPAGEELCEYPSNGVAEAPDYHPTITTGNGGGCKSWKNKR